MTDNKKAPEIGTNKHSNTIITDNNYNYKCFEECLQPELLKENIFVGFNINKAPINLMTGEFAKTSDNKTWCNFEYAINNYSRYKNVLGLGIVFTSTPYGQICGIDIDECRDDNCKINKEAQSIIDMFDSYTEISANGKGVHILIFANKKIADCKKSGFDFCHDIEIYDRTHFFTVTGNIINKSIIKEKQAECDLFCNKYFQKKENKITESVQKTTCNKADEYYLNLGMQRDKKLISLYNGDRPNRNESSDDLALLTKLCYWCNRNYSLIVETFLNSPYVRQKDNKHLKKLEREDYIKRTLDKINLPVTARDYDQKYQTNVVKSDSQIDIAKFIKGISEVEKAKNYEWVIENLFAKDYISILFGEAGTGKTWIILHICLAISNGLTLWQDIKPEKQKVMLFEGDAPVSILKERIYKLDKPLDDDYFKYVSRYEVETNGINLNLFTHEGRKNLEAFIANFKPALVIVDTLISFIDDETKADMVKIVVDNLRNIAEKYNCHILLVHHARKRSKGEKRSKLDQSDVIGTSVLSRLASVTLGIDKNEQ